MPGGDRNPWLAKGITERAGKFNVSLWSLFPKSCKLFVISSSLIKFI